MKGFFVFVILLDASVISHIYINTNTLKNTNTQTYKHAHTTPTTNSMLGYDRF